MRVIKSLTEILDQSFQCIDPLKKKLYTNKAALANAALPDHILIIGDNEQVFKTVFTTDGPAVVEITDMFVGVNLIQDVMSVGEKAVGMSETYLWA